MYYFVNPRAEHLLHNINDFTPGFESLLIWKFGETFAGTTSIMFHDNTSQCYKIAKLTDSCYWTYQADKANYENYKSASLQKLLPILANTRPNSLETYYETIPTYKHQQNI